MRILYARSNIIVRLFHSCSSHVLFELLNTQISVKKKYSYEILMRHYRYSNSFFVVLL